MHFLRLAEVCGIMKRIKTKMEDYTMAKKKEPTNGEKMAKAIMAEYQPKTV